MNLDIKKEDLDIKEDGSITINNPELKAKIAELAAESDVIINQCVAGCGCK